ncbi:hypothetical protein N9Y42_08270 [Mariniblastus sp.]|nr:hypothetical protein [Mariniblastus sp.]
MPVPLLIQDLHVVAFGPIILMCLREAAQADTFNIQFGTVVNLF